MKTLATSERVGRVGQRRQVVIPRDILEGLNLQAGDLVSFAEHRNGILIKPKRARKPAVDADDTLTPSEEKMVRRGEAEFKRGETKPWREVKNALSL
ncbi:MAG TPA: AbrB/MazE/SpoVT family DNA-binding domain-containing protein [Bryobacteraceae bacterium]|jgi:AbrB family looped-hinge helix DNA binding protein|nr:AbrB/MazE/SpoVT family DNA-binding domain-containing protein [Bryobacteraceae bacterium]